MMKCVYGHRIIRNDTIKKHSPNGLCFDFFNNKQKIFKKIIKISKKFINSIDRIYNLVYNKFR